MFVKYVSFSEAKKLKENGFDENVQSMYDENGVISPFCGSSSNSKVKIKYPNDVYYARPEYNGVDEWLKKNNIYIVVTPYKDEKSDYIHTRFSLTIFGIIFDEVLGSSELIELFKDYGFSEYQTANDFGIAHSIQNYCEFIKRMRQHSRSVPNKK